MDAKTATALKQHFAHGAIVDSYGGQQDLVVDFKIFEPGESWMTWAVYVREITTNGLGHVREHCTLPNSLLSRERIK